MQKRFNKRKPFINETLKVIKDFEINKNTRIGVVITSKRNNLDLRYRSDEKFFMCSIPKIIWVSYAFKCIEDGLFKLNSEIKIQNKRYSQYAFGTGTLQYLLIKANTLKNELKEKLKHERIKECKKQPKKIMSTITLKRVMELSVKKSDNLAVISLVDFLEENDISRSQVQKWLEDITCSEDIILMDPERTDKKNLNWGTLDSLAMFCSELFKGDLINKENLMLLTKWMQDTESENRLGIIADKLIKVIHKTGQIDKYKIPTKKYFTRTYCDIGVIRKKKKEIFAGIFAEVRFKKSYKKDNSERISKIMLNSMQEIAKLIRLLL